MGIVQIRKQLKSRGMDAEGAKKDMVSRLKTAVFGAETVTAKDAAKADAKKGSAR